MMGVNNKASFSKIIVTLVILLNIIFSIAILTVFVKVGSEPTSLVVAWFSFTTAELFALAFIKNNKEKNKGVVEDDEQRILDCEIDE